MTRRRSAVLATGWLLACAACAPALREPPSLDELRAEAPGGGPASAETLLGQARESWAARDTRSVRRAAELWTRAAVDHGSLEGWIGAARARVWLADHEATAEARGEAARAAVQAAQWCGRVAPDSPACAYWLAVALGVQARERRATALDALPRMVRTLRSVIEREPELEHGGPHRVLALVLLRAPGWPTGPGDPEEGLEQARAAVAVDPAYPPNRLCLAEALAVAGDPGRSREEYVRAEELARGRLEAGDPDAAEWVARAREALGGTAAP